MTSLFDKTDLQQLTADSAAAKVASQQAETLSQGNKTLLENSSFGLSPIKSVIDQVLAKVGIDVPAIKAKTDLLSGMQTTLNNIWTRVDSEVAAIKAKTDLLSGMQTTLNTVNSNTSSGSGIKSVQRGLRSGNGSITVAAVDMSKSLLITDFSHFGGPNVNTANAYLSSSTSIAFTSSAGITNQKWRWQLVEFY